jgi:hypothetical protein
MRRAIAVLAAVLLASCVTATQCEESIPVELRADTMRYVIDQQLLDEGLMPREALTLGYSQGTPYLQLTEDRRRLLARYAVAYSSCIRQRVNRN